MAFSKGKESGTGRRKCSFKFRKKGYYGNTLTPFTHCTAARAWRQIIPM